jgi:hypothetical protein
MNVSPTEAEEALAEIQNMAQKTRKSIASGGTYITLIVTGIVWMTGFMCTQFLPAGVVGYIWGGLSLLGTIAGIILGNRMGRRVRSPATIPMVKRVGLFWLLLVFFALAVIAVARPADGKQATLLVILFIMLGQMAMGLLFSFASVWWTLPIAALALAGYFLLPGIFYLLLAILGGGGMIALGLTIWLRW